MLKSTSLLYDFFAFVKNPNYKFLNISLSKKFLGISILLFIKIVIALISWIIISNILAKFDIERINAENQVDNSYKSVFLATVLLAPIIEELAFRLSLKFNKTYFMLGIAVLGFIILTKLYYRTMLFSLSGLDEKLIFITFIIILFYLILSNKKIHNTLKSFWKNHLNIIVYASVILFGFMHLFNYKLTIWVILLSPLIVFSQIISGFVLSYLRIRFGIISAILFHMFWNLIL